MFVYMPDKDCSWSESRRSLWHNRGKRPHSRMHLQRNGNKQFSTSLSASNFVFPFLSLPCMVKEKQALSPCVYVYALDFHLLVNSFVSPSQWFQTYHFHCISIRLRQSVSRSVSSRIVWLWSIYQKQEQKLWQKRMKKVTKNRTNLYHRLLCAIVWHSKHFSLLCICLCVFMRWHFPFLRSTPTLSFVFV